MFSILIDVILVLSYIIHLHKLEICLTALMCTLQVHVCVRINTWLKRMGRLETRIDSLVPFPFPVFQCCTLKHWKAGIGTENPLCSTYPYPIDILYHTHTHTHTHTPSSLLRGCLGPWVQLGPLILVSEQGHCQPVWTRGLLQQPNMEGRSVTF